MPALAAFAPSARGDGQPQALGYENLLHELIMAMQGYTGDVFLDCSDARCVALRARAPAAAAFVCAARVTTLTRAPPTHNTQH